MGTEKYIPRIPEVNFKTNTNLDLLDANIGFKRLFNIGSEMPNFGTLILECDKLNLIHYLKNFNHEQEDNIFFVQIISRINIFNSLLYITKNNDDTFDIEMKELEYNIDIYEDTLIKEKEYAQVLSGIDSYYFVYNCIVKRLSIKSTKTLGNLSDIHIDGIKPIFKSVLKVDSNYNNNDEIINNLINDLKDDIDNKEYKLEIKDNNYYTFHTKLISLKDKKYIVSTVLISKNVVINTSYLEKNDALTGLFNKKTITEMAINRIETVNVPGSLFVLDIDRFKECNDLFGHQYGDQVLKKVGEILKESLGASGIAGRIGGDEFMCIVDSTDNEDIRNITRNIKIGLQWAMSANHPNNLVSCSIGVARFPINGTSYEEIFALADKCLYRAKSKGRNCYIIYDPDKHNKIFEENEIEKKRILDGIEYKRMATIEANILEILLKKEDNYRVNALAMLMDYLSVSNIMLYNDELYPIINLKNIENVREEFIHNDDYFKFFNFEDFFVSDNVNSIEIIDKPRFKMYQKANIASTLEIKITKDGVFKGLLTLDILKPARTFKAISIVFALLVSQKLF